MANIFNVADYYIAASDPQELITPLKLQKMCAYAQGICLALLGKPLFDDDIKAWKYGPVIPSLYHKYESNGKFGIDPEGLDEVHARQAFSDEEKFVIEFVKDYYGKYSATKLSEMSHYDFVGDFGSKEIISKESIKQTFEQHQVIIDLKTNNIEKQCDMGKKNLVLFDEVLNALEA